MPAGKKDTLEQQVTCNLLWPRVAFKIFAEDREKKIRFYFLLTLLEYFFDFENLKRHLPDSHWMQFSFYLTKGLLIN